MHLGKQDDEQKDDLMDNIFCEDLGTKNSQFAQELTECP